MTDPFTTTHLNLLIFGCIVDRTFAVFVQRQLCSVIEQPAHCSQMAARGGKMQRRGAVAVAQIRIDALFVHLVSRIVEKKGQ